VTEDKRGESHGDSWQATAQEFASGITARPARLVGWIAGRLGSSVNASSISRLASGPVLSRQVLDRAGWGRALSANIGRVSRNIIQSLQAADFALRPISRLWVDRDRPSTSRSDDYSLPRYDDWSQAEAHDAGWERSEDAYDPMADSPEAGFSDIAPQMGETLGSEIDSRSDSAPASEGPAGSPPRQRRAIPEPPKIGQAGPSLQRMGVVTPVVPLAATEHPLSRRSPLDAGAAESAPQELEDRRVPVAQESTLQRAASVAPAADEAVLEEPDHAPPSERGVDTVTSAPAESVEQGVVIGEGPPRPTSSKGPEIPAKPLVVSAARSSKRREPDSPTRRLDIAVSQPPFTTAAQASSSAFVNDLAGIAGQPSSPVLGRMEDATTEEQEQVEDTAIPTAREAGSADVRLAPEEVMRLKPPAETRPATGLEGPDAGQAGPERPPMAGRVDAKADRETTTMVDGESAAVPAGEGPSSAEIVFSEPGAGAEVQRSPIAKPLRPIEGRGQPHREPDVPHAGGEPASTDTAQPSVQRYAGSAGDDTEAPEPIAGRPATGIPLVQRRDVPPLILRHLDVKHDLSREVVGRYSGSEAAGSDARETRDWIDRSVPEVAANERVYRSPAVPGASVPPRAEGKRVQASPHSRSGAGPLFLSADALASDIERSAYSGDRFAESEAESIRAAGPLPDVVQPARSEGDRGWIERVVDDGGGRGWAHGGFSEASAGLVQRAEGQETGSAAESEGEEGGGGGEVDVERLAREVYAIIKRRLATERERLACR